MKMGALVRKLDDLGRIVLPKELRNSWGIKEGDPMEVLVEDDKIILRQYNPACYFCNETKDLVEYKGKKVCKNCVNDIKKIG